MLDLFGKIFRTLSGRDAKVFIVSLLLAYGIWLTHNLTMNYTELIDVPVKALCDINGHSYVSVNSTVVTAKCRASGFSLIKLMRADRKSPVEVTFNTSDMHSSGGEMFYVTSEDFSRYFSQIFGNGTKLEAFVSDTLMFRFPYENHKKVPVQPVYTVSFKPQYVNASALKVVPDSVTVYGDPEALSTITRVYTESLTLSNLSSSVHGDVKLDVLAGVRLSDTYVRYNLPVSRYVEIKSKVPVVATNVPKGKYLIVYPSVAEVTFRCAFPVTSDPSDRMKLYVDYADFEKSLDGQCVPTADGVPVGVLGYHISPEVFDCVESLR